MPQVTAAHLEQEGTPLDKGVKLTSLRPIIHPPAQPRAKHKGLPAPTEPPPLHQIFAEAFSRLPSIHSYMAGFCRTGRELYHYLFSGTPPSAATVENQDDPMGAAISEKYSLFNGQEVTVFSQMVDECIDIPGSFEDPHRLSAPEIQGSENRLHTLTIQSPTRPSFASLVQHLTEHPSG